MRDGLIEVKKAIKAVNDLLQDVKVTGARTEGLVKAYSTVKGILCDEVQTPTVDAVGVVRCGECVYKETADFGGDILMGCCHPCGMQDIHDDCFCSYGERKDGDE